MTKLAIDIDSNIKIANKQVAKLEQEEFTDKSLIELKIKELTAKLKYHQILE
jgi:hypothetical protein